MKRLENGECLDKEMFLVYQSHTDFVAVGVIQIIQMIRRHRFIGNDDKICFRYVME